MWDGTRESLTPSPLRLCAAVAALALGCAVGACGSQAKHPSTAGADATEAAELRPAPLEAEADADKDNDIGAAADDTDNRRDFAFGHAVSPSVSGAVTALVKRYYAVALAGQGARGCAMLYSTIAEGLVEDDSREPGGPPYMRGASTCTQVLDALYHHFHAQFAAEVPILQVTSVRLQGGYGYAFLRFGSMPEREIPVKREGRVWRMAQTYDLPLG